MQATVFEKKVINLKSLSAEAKIIRHETRRCGYAYRSMLSHHRRTRLREEARATHLALAFLRERPYRCVEREGSKLPDVDAVVRKLTRLGYNGDIGARVHAWVNA